MDNVVNNFVRVTQEHKHVVVKGAGGLQGLPGPAGAGLEISGSVNTYAELPYQLTIYDAGKAYFVQADGLLYVWTGERWPNEGDGAQFQGPRGIQGPQGEKGETGATGATGPQGPDGFSPTVTATETTDGIDITIVDKNGTATTSIDYRTLPDDAVTTNTISDGAVTTAKIASQSVTGTKIDWSTMDDIFYKPGDVVTIGDGTAYIEVLNGFLTSSNTDLVVAIPMAKRLDNITGATITSISGEYRCQGAYLTGSGTDITTLATQLVSVSTATNSLTVTFHKTSGNWGATNNSTVSLGIKTMTITLS